MGGIDKKEIILAIVIAAVIGSIAGNITGMWWGHSFLIEKITKIVESYKPSTPQNVENYYAVCTDGKDNDGDGLIDKQDPDCAYLNKPRREYTPLCKKKGCTCPSQKSRIIIGGCDETFKYIDNPDLYLGKIEIAEGCEYYERLIPEYLDDIRKSAVTVSVSQTLGRCTMSITVPVAAYVAPYVAEKAENMAIKNFQSSADEISFETEGEGHGYFVIKNVKRKYYKIEMDGEPVKYGPVERGEIRYEFEQSAHKFRIELSDRDLLSSELSLQPTPEIETEKKITVSGQVTYCDGKVERFVCDVTENFVDPKELKASMSISLSINFKNLYIHYKLSRPGYENLKNCNELYTRLMNQYGSLCEYIANLDAVKRPVNKFKSYVTERGCDVSFNWPEIGGPSMSVTCPVRVTVK